MTEMTEKIYWLIKSEPITYSWSRLEDEKHTVWDGIRNFAARNFLRAMQKNDLVLFYHSNEGKEIVGVAKVIKTAYPDPTNPDASNAWCAVDIAPVCPLIRPVSLAEIRQNPRLHTMLLLRQSRLSVTPVTSEEFQTILTLGRTSLKMVTGDLEESKRR